MTGEVVQLYEDLFASRSNISGPESRKVQTILSRMFLRLELKSKDGLDETTADEFREWIGGPEFHRCCTDAGLHLPTITAMFRRQIYLGFDGRHAELERSRAPFSQPQP